MAGFLLCLWALARKLEVILCVECALQSLRRAIKTMIAAGSDCCQHQLFFSFVLPNFVASAESHTCCFGVWWEWVL